MAAVALALRTSGGIRALKTIGATLMIGGPFVLAGGIVLLATSGTSAELRDGWGPPREEASRREPRWWAGEF